jgi:hypothetical protein
MDVCDGPGERRAGANAECRSHEIGVICEALACVRQAFCFRTDASARKYRRWRLLSSFRGG